MKKLAKFTTYTPLKTIQNPVPNDISVSQSVKLQDITEFALGLGMEKEHFLPYGESCAKVKLSSLNTETKRGKYVCVTGINPTSLGEGKTTSCIGISQAIGAHLHKNVFTCIRQPSQGPTFGLKGGAAGGGYSQVVPMENFNLHLTGDLHAITAANNLIASAVDTRWYHETTIKSDEKLFDLLCPVVKGKRNFSVQMKPRLAKLGITETDPDKLTKEEKTKFARLNIDPQQIHWRRVVDINDRMLREIQTGLGEEEKGHTLKTGYDITVASELMAILALTSDLEDMKKRIGRCVVALDKDSNPLTVDDFGVAGAATVLMKDTIMPNLMQTIEGTPVFVHAGPFANIAHGNSSIIADKIALSLVGEDGYVLTEAGFGADIGFEKFCNIKTRYSGIAPDAVVLVVSIRALKCHGGVDIKDINKENVEATRKGCENMVKHIENIISFGVPVVVCINEFNADTKAEVDVVKEVAKHTGAFDVVESRHWQEGGAGAKAIAESVVKACQTESKFKFTYDVKLTIKEKILSVCKEIYGAKDVTFSEQAELEISNITKNGFDHLPICMAKTQYSLSSDPKLLGRPTGFTVPVKEIRTSAGAGLLVVLLGSIRTMPGLTVHPAYYDIDIDKDGNITGLY
jgi:methylenetetrahydrofolate dehydrogenase (NADP+)/methenyltetrahydrofolate cyclohydrolase/formyltetrahydrofolate synthetase